MARLKTSVLAALLPLLLSCQLKAQDLDSLIGLGSVQSEAPILNSFKASRIINCQSVEIPGKGDFLLVISHRFGEMKGGLYNFFGLDQASMRVGLEYGLGKRMGLNVGRNTYEKTYDGGLKYILLKQGEQAGLPLSVSLFSSFSATTLKWPDPERDNLFSSRISYVHQILIAHRMGSKLNLQLSPTYIHRNLVLRTMDQNDIFAAGLGVSYHIGRRFTVNSEYNYILPGQTAKDFNNSLSIGVDVETGGHVFQLHLTNSRAMFERGFITETTGDWTKGDIYLGFNLVRVLASGRNLKNK
jgi:hypothetical protein